MSVHKIVTEVYETKDDQFAGLVVFFDIYGDRISFSKEIFVEKFEAEKFAFDTAFENRNTKDFTVAKYDSNPGRRDYELRNYG